MKIKKREIELISSLFLMIFGMVFLILNLVNNKFTMFELGVSIILVGLVFYIIKDGISDKIIEKMDSKRIKEYDVNDYENRVFKLTKPKREWFKALHLHMIQNDYFKSEDELTKALEKYCISKKEFIFYKDEFIKFSTECNLIYDDIYFSKLKQILDE